MGAAERQSANPNDPSYRAAPITSPPLQSSLRGLIPIAILLAAAGCSHRAGPPTYRYVTREKARIMIPPGIAAAATSQRSFTFRTAAPRGAKCVVSENGVEIRSHKRELRVIVNRQPLLAASPGWLATWTGSLE